MHLSYEAVMFITFDFWKVRVGATINHNFIEDIKNFPGHRFSISKNLTSEAHSESYIDTFHCIVSVDDSLQILPMFCKLFKRNTIRIIKGWED